MSRAPIEPGQAATLANGFQRSLAPRGPNGWRAHHDRNVLLVHRRLSILDLSVAGAQPLWNEDETVCVIVNGEIYNFEELRSGLCARGHRFRSRSDSEVLVHAYEEDGIDGCCRAAKGMFAFALWDARSRDLFLVRDRLGIKPLLIAEHGEGVTFGSTLASVLSDAAVPNALRPEALISVLKWGFVPSPWSAVLAVRHLRAGSWVRVREGRVVEERVWWRDLPAGVPIAEEELRQTIEASVRSHLVADVPIGALLSAGIDSGLVVALASRNASGALEAWTVSHRGSAENEFDEAALAARHFGIVLHEIPIGTGGLTEGRFDGMIQALSEPLADASLVGMHSLFETISSERQVVLSGDGGDELFGGYGWHAGMPTVPPWARTALFQAAAPALACLSSVPGKAGVLGKVARRVRRHPASVYLDKLRITSDDELSQLGIDPRQPDPITATAIEAWGRFEGDTLEQMLAVDRATSLIDRMLAKVDGASMAHSVEARVPLLADDVLSAAKRVPSSHKRAGDQGKIVLRDFYRTLAPPGLAERRKTGFDSPLAGWLRGEFGDGLIERSRHGLGLVGATRRDISPNPNLLFASAVLASWVERVRGQVQAAA